MWRVAGTGKRILVEKPLEINLNRANALVQACEAPGVTLAIMLQHRLREAALGLAALIKSGELGALVSATASVRWWRPQSYYNEPGRGTLARDGGGVLITQAIHTLGMCEVSGDGANPMSFDHGAHRAVLQDFIRAIQNATAPAVTGRSALGMQRVIEAIMTSSQTGRKVWLDPTSLLPVM